MEINLRRKWYYDDSTLGELYVDGKWFCYTLEDEVRKVKVYGETAIPEGRYRVQTTYSNRFKKMLPLLYNVPGFSGIRIHSGNTDDDTDGCILVGNTKLGPNWVGESRVALKNLQTLIDLAEKKKQDVWITVS